MGDSSSQVSKDFTISFAAKEQDGKAGKTGKDHTRTYLKIGDELTDVRSRGFVSKSKSLGSWLRQKLNEWAGYEARATGVGGQKIWVKSKDMLISDSEEDRAESTARLTLYSNPESKKTANLQDIARVSARHDQYTKLRTALFQAGQAEIGLGKVPFERFRRGDAMPFTEHLQTKPSNDREAIGEVQEQRKLLQTASEIILNERQKKPGKNLDERSFLESCLGGSNKPGVKEFYQESGDIALRILAETDSYIERKQKFST
jgi:hypothetical protein